MRHLLNTLFVTSEDVYLSLDGENVVASRDKQTLARYPLHTLSGIISFSYSGRIARPDGCLCSAGYCIELLLSQGTVSCQNNGHFQRKCAPAAHAIPHCR